MADDQAPGQEPFERSREHRRGVQQACVDLDHALARPAGLDPRRWSADAAARLDQLDKAFQHHVVQSEGPEGLLPQIVQAAPRLAHAVERVKQDHRALLAEIDRLETATTDVDDAGDIHKVREESLRLLQSIAAHRQSGADLIYEAYSVDVEGGDSG